MKSLFTLLLTCMISLSLMGQHNVKDLKKQRHVKKHHSSFSALEKKMSRSPDQASRHLVNRYRTIENITLKSESADMQKMDSLEYHDYDTASQQWVVTGKDIFTYDSKGNMIKYVSYELDTATMKIVPTWKEDLTFDANGNITEYLLYQWDKSTGQWVNDEKYEDTFDGNGKLIEEIWYLWDTDSKQWIKYELYEMTYDAGGNMTSELGSYWDADGSAWIPYFKDEYTYTEDLLLEILELYYYESAWINNYRTKSTYNAAAKLASEVTEEWDLGSSKWVDFYKWEYTYNTQGLNTEEVEYEWDIGSTIWLNTWKYEYTYDEQRNITEDLWYEWYNEKWNRDWRGVMAYNLLHTIQNLFVPYWFLNGQVYEYTVYHMPLSMTSYLPVLATWIYWWRQVAFYSAFSPTNIQDIEKGTVNIFPNPASDYITVTWNDNQPRLDLEVLDLAGKLVLSRTVDNNATINITELSKGLYLYRLSDNRNVVYTGKISLK